MRKTSALGRGLVGWSIKDPPLTRWVYGKGECTGPRACRLEYQGPTSHEVGICPPSRGLRDLVGSGLRTRYNGSNSICEINAFSPTLSSSPP
jgi:hypothetical protein